MSVAPRFTPARAAALAALCGLWVAACSADVDGYHFPIDGLGDSGGTGPGEGGASADAGGNRSSSGGATSSGGRTTLLTSGGRAGSGGDPPDSSVIGNGGAGGLGGNGGNGGLGAGGTPGTGGSGNGGILGSGGIVGTGGIVGSGGIVGAGGAVAWPGNPVATSPSPAVTGITAAAWEPTSKHFFLLKAATREIYELNPATGQSSLVHTVAATSIAAHPFGVSKDSYYVVANKNAIHRIPRLGGTTTTVSLSVALTDDTPLSGAYAGGWFVVGYANGATQALQDGTAVLSTPAKSVTKAYGMVTDGASFVFSTPSPAVEGWIERLPAGSFSPPTVHCVLASQANLGTQLSVHGSTVAWVIQTQLNYSLNVASLTASACSPPAQSTFGISSAASTAVGLLDDQYAIVVSVVSPPTATFVIIDTDTGAPGNPVSSSGMGAGRPDFFVMGNDSPTRRALLVTRDRPILVSF